MKFYEYTVHDKWEMRIMKKKEIMVLGKISHEILYDLKKISNKIAIITESVLNKAAITRLKTIKPDIIIIFAESFEKDGILIIKDFISNLKNVKISIICVGTEEKCDFVEKQFDKYEVYKHLLPFSDFKIKCTILNLMDEAVQPEVSLTYNKKPKVIEDNKREKSILIVDDDVNILRMISAYLNDKYKVSVVNSGMAAMSYLENKKPDLILLDYLMPICDGKQTLNMIRHMDETKDIPVMFLTGVSDKNNVLRCLSLNPQGYILKPVTKEDLLERVKEVLEPDDEIDK